MQARKLVRNDYPDYIGQHTRGARDFASELSYPVRLRVAQSPSERTPQIRLSTRRRSRLKEFGWIACSHGLAALIATFLALVIVYLIIYDPGKYPKGYAPRF